MAKRKQARRRVRAQLPITALPDLLQRHVRALRQASVESYLDWCREHGFPARWTNKSASQLQRELARAEEDRLRGREQNSRRQRRPDRLLIRALDAWDAGQQGSKVAFSETAFRSVRDVLASDATRPAECAFAAALLRHVATVCPDLLFEHAWERGPLWIDGVVRLARFVGRARREVEAWRPRSKNCAKRFGSLARHLYADWDVPAFFDRVWLDDDALASVGRGWFVDVAQGGNLRTADGLPFPMTKKVAHATMRAPDGFSLAEALRWGQIHGLGGDARIALALRGTKLTEIHTIRELCNSVLLHAEGASLGHCVASYAGSCAAGACSIWSLELQRFDDDKALPRRKWVTIEVRRATQTIVQARGRRNKKLDAAARAVIARWAKSAGLGIADWV